MIAKSIYIFTNSGISMIYVVPSKAPPSLLSFLQPFNNDLWMTMGAGKAKYFEMEHVLVKLYSN